MLRYKSLFFIESDNYIFRYNTNNDKLFVNKKENYIDERIDRAERLLFLQYMKEKWLG